MKYLVTLSAIILACVGSIKAQVFFSEDFEQGIPINWTQEYLTSSASWYIENGGLGGEHPDTAYQGNYNAILQQNGSSKITRLITPMIDLGDVVKAQLQFGHAMTEYVGIDELTVECREHPDSAWVEIAYYGTAVPNWVFEEIQIPDSLTSSTSAIAFKGKTNYGGGICIDLVEVIEVGIVPLQVKSIDAANFAYTSVPSGSNNNPILRTIINVVGNTGTLNFEEITYQSLNTDNADIRDGGLSLFYSKDTLLRNVELVAGNVNFEDGAATFSDLTVPLSFGTNVFWLTYNVDSALSHDQHNHVLDAKINADDIVIEGYTYPFEDLNPSGNLWLKESLFFDNFEGAINWNLIGEFEIDQPSGLGVTGDGNPDPEFATSPVNVLGTDLTGLGETEGAYENNLTEAEDQAVSPYVNVDYYKDLNLFFWRWLNVDFFDDATIDVRKNQSNWGTVWINNSYNNDNFWRVYEYGLHDSLFYRDSLQMRFAMGPSDEENNQSGWNIDNFAITGDYIAYDVGVSAWIAPGDGCGHTDQDFVTVKIRNYGGEASPANIPIEYSIDNGANWVQEVYPSSIPVGGEATFTFSGTADMSQPGTYNVIARTVMSQDEFFENNRFDTTIFVTPSYSLPYTQSFELGADYWISGGENSTWQIKQPHQAISGPYIDTAYNGVRCWVTNYEGSYLANDSSFIQSPCFDFTGTEAPILEFAVFTDFQAGVDGANVLYSIDNGQSWNLLATNADYSQNWYTNASVVSLDNPGWDQPNTGWFIARNLLPQALTAYESVKFRIMIEADQTIENEGVAIDRVRLYDAPYDIGLTALNYPVTDCEIGDAVYPEIEIQNDGVSSLPVGLEVPINLYFKENFIVRDTFELSSPLAVNNTRLLTFDTALYMDTAGTYAFEFINKFNETAGFYTSDNDTLYTQVIVEGMPQYNPFPDVTGKNSPFVELDAGAGYTYSWSTGHDRQVLQAYTEGTFYVTVTNGNGCTAIDSTTVINSVDDMELTQVLTSIPDQCQRPDPVFVEIELTNYGEAFTAGTELPVAYQVNQEAEILDTITLSGDLAVGASVQYTFSEGMDLSEPGQYNIAIYSNIDKDLDKSNDTAYLQVNTWGEPVIGFFGDTIYTGQPDTVVLNAGAGMDSYLWQDNTTNQTYNVNSDVSQWYYLTVDDVYNCGPATDSIYLNTSDLGILGIEVPSTACGHTAAETITVQIENRSGDYVNAGEQWSFGIQLNEEGPVYEQFTLNEAIEPNTSVFLDLNTTINLQDTGIYELTVWIDKELDNSSSNDTAITSIATLGYPDVELGPDTIFTTQPDTLFFDASEQFSSYLWHDGSTNPYFMANQDTSYLYKVTVSNEDGCGTDSDSVQVFTYNVGLAEIINPESNCELSEAQQFDLKITNYGPDNLYPGEVIQLSYQVNSTGWNRQDITLSDTLLSGNDIIRRISEPYDMSAFMRYDIAAAVHFEKDATLNNDTIAETIETFGYPPFEINYDIINSTQPDTIDLIVTPSNYVSYLWHVGIDNDTLQLDTLNEPFYAVTVSDIHGCFTVDTVPVNQKNIGFHQLLSPESACQHTPDENISVRLLNSGYDTIDAGSVITLNVTSPELITENLTLSAPLYPNDSVDYTFTQGIDLNAEGSYDIAINLEADFDAAEADNLLNQTIETYGPAEVDLGNEITIDELPYLLDAGAGFSSYLWHDGSTNQSFSIDETNITGTGLYSVTVVNDMGCAGNDSRRVNVNIFDWAAESITEPQGDCFNSFPQVTAMFSNQSSVPVRQGRQFYISYALNGGAIVEEVFTLEDSVYPQQMYNYIFDQIPAYEAEAVGVLEVNLDNGGDQDPANNSVTQTFTMHLNTMAFESDTLRPGSFPETITAPGGYASYEWSTGQSGQTISVINPGWYSVTAYDYESCAATDSIYVTDPTGINDLNKHQQITIWPNPASKTLWVKFHRETAGWIHYELVSASGDVVLSNEKTIRSGEIIEIPVHAMAEGIYMLRFYDDDEYGTETLIIAH